MTHLLEAIATFAVLTLLAFAVARLIYARPIRYSEDDPYGEGR
jgi:hypothetical protein